ncbi:GTP cyclohydrolase I type 1 [hydrothermal vent metagenome]|uniref:GTP cyclohydrolase I n=1 Tax=hydrothermal vent metagenome TaxID=652676 RepID=A0A3B0T814_9ZZZZ
MDAVIKSISVKDKIAPRPGREQAEEAVRTLIAYLGDDPARAGLVDTPKRVIDAYGELFSGYADDPEAVLSRTFEELNGYDDVVMLRGIDINSHCEHHMMPFIGTAHVAYLPGENIVGISKLVRVIDIYARRLQSQENLTAGIAATIDKVLKPKGVAVMIEAVHHCMTMRGVAKRQVATLTTQFTGAFKHDPALQARFVAQARDPAGPVG